MKRSSREEATSYGDSEDGLVGDDVIGDVIQSQESAGSLLSRRKRKRRRRGPSRKLQCNQQMLFEDSKTIRKQQYFQSRAYLYQLLLCIQSLGNPVARREEAGEVKRFNQSQDSVAIFQQKRERSSSRLNSAGAKQLTNYEESRELDVNC
ncbi:hypothetical protein F511_46138 [Dorcoceras hygrometricum]|uniref:Uncharacterized protein n=1 Tax=Dorcoceras hygrometricum TaxID=472368 RepID=A0A2Z6ZUA2_9LAMI|nr:hypothetical protein F511_46138 [Dorcoceras hygrometricum]